MKEIETKEEREGFRRELGVSLIKTRYRILGQFLIWEGVSPSDMKEYEEEMEKEITEFLNKETVVEIEAGGENHEV